MSAISSQQDDGSLKTKKKGEQGLKSKRGSERFYQKKLHVSKEEKERMKFTSCWERFY
jgi:hypothetical protein